MNKNIKVVTRAILITDGGKVLLAKRAKGRGQGQWALIGGKPEEGESDSEAVVREVLEETGLTFIPTIYKEEIDEISDPGETWRVVYFEGPYSGEINLKLDELTDVLEVSLDDLEDLEIALNHKDILRGYFNGQT